MAKIMNDQHTIKDEKHEIALSEPVKNLGKLDSFISDLYSRAIEQGGAVPTSRAVLLNLVIYAASTELADEAFNNASQILSSVACRTILIDRSAAKPEVASVSLICGISERGDKRLCGEVIRVYAVGGPVAGLVLPLLIPDVPVFLWVYGEIPTDREDFADLLRVADYVVADSRTDGKTAANLRAIDRLRKIEGGKRIVRDLGWACIQPWREATALHFDALSIRHYLQCVDEVTIKYSGLADKTLPESPALLFVSWLMEMLRMIPSEVFHSKDEGYRITARQDSRSVTLRLIPEDSSLAIGRLIMVKVSCTQADRPGVFTTEAISPTQLVLTEDCRDICLPQKLMEIPNPNDSALAASALSSYRRDHVFARSLDMALQVISQAELADERSARVRL